MAEPEDYEIIAGIGNEVFYFFVFVFLSVLVVLAWYSTQVLEPVVQSVILVERTPLTGSSLPQASSAEEVREAVSQFLQHSQGQETEEEAWPETRQQEELVAEEQAESVQETLPELERVTIRLKFLNETQKDVEASLVENLGQFKRRNFTEELGNNKNVRLIFNGQVLRDEGSSLRSCGLFDMCVVHCLVSALPPPSSPPAPRPGRQEQHGHHHHQHRGGALDVSSLFIPLLGLALALVWYMALTYNSYFNLMSTTALLGLTSLYLLSVYGTHFHVNVAVRTGGGQGGEAAR